MFKRIKEWLSGGATSAALPGTPPESANLSSRFVCCINTCFKRFIYGYINTRFKDSAEIRFLNYGFASLDGARLALLPQDEPDRVHIQLYHHVAARINLAGRKVLEVSCGRGGGAAYVKRSLKPAVMCGLDRAEGAIRFWGRHCMGEGVHFLRGDALAMPFGDQSFDAVLNLEASHDYPDFPRFLAEVVRLLKPGGHFLYADFRKDRDCGLWKQQLLNSGLKLLEEEDVSRQVVKGLEANTPQTTEIVRRLVHWPLRFVFMQFAGVKGSMMHKSFVSGRQKYKRYLLQK